MITLEQISSDIQNKVWKIIEENLSNYPEDDWVGISDDWDLNLWLEECEGGIPRKRATLFKVYDGNTSVDDDDCIELSISEP